MTKISQNSLRRSYAMVAGLLAALLTAGTARASFIETITQIGPNVVATGSGTIDLTDLGLAGGSLTDSFVFPSEGEIVTGATIIDAHVSDYLFISGPSFFGGDGRTIATAGSGDTVGLGPFSELLVPLGYISGDALSSAATWDNATFFTLRTLPGIYTWTWGSGNHADSFVLRIIGAVSIPEPASLALFGLGLVAAGAFRRRKKA